METIWNALIISVATLIGIYLKERYFFIKNRQEISVIKSNCYIELDKICSKIRKNVKASGVYIAYFHNGGTFINGVRMDKFTVVGEDYDTDMTSYKRKYKDCLINNAPYMFHNLITNNRHSIDIVQEVNEQDKMYKEELKSRSINSSYSFLITDPISNNPIGFISIEYHKSNSFDINKEGEIWKRQNEIANLLNMKFIKEE